MQIDTLYFKFIGSLLSLSLSLSLTLAKTKTPKITKIFILFDESKMYEKIRGAT